MFSSAMDYMRTYLKSKRDALRNTKRATWFTTGVDTYDQFCTTVFNSDSENDEWEKLYVASTKGQTLKQHMQALRLKVDFLVSCRWAVRDQFAVREEHDGKTGSDIQRHTFIATLASHYATDMLDKHITNLSKVKV